MKICNYVITNHPFSNTVPSVAFCKHLNQSFMPTPISLKIIELQFSCRISINEFVNLYSTRSCEKYDILLISILLYQRLTFKYFQNENNSINDQKFQFLSVSVVLLFYDSSRLYNVKKQLFYVKTKSRSTI